METHIYSLTDPRSGLVRYIGKTINMQVRLRRHLQEAMEIRRNRRCVWIRKLLRLGLRPQMNLLETCPGDGCAEERYQIALARSDGLPLLNHTDGGDGVPGYHPTPETRRLLSQQKRNLWNLFHLQRLSASPAVRAKISAANRLKLKTPEWNASVSRGLRSSEKFARYAERRNQTIAGPDLDRLKTLYAEGYSIKELAGVFNRQHRTIRKYLLRNGIRLRGRAHTDRTISHLIAARTRGG